MRGWVGVEVRSTWLGQHLAAACVLGVGGSIATEGGNVRGLHCMAGGKVWSSRVSERACVFRRGGGNGVVEMCGFVVALSCRAHVRTQGLQQQGEWERGVGGGGLVH